MFYRKYLISDNHERPQHTPTLKCYQSNVHGIEVNGDRFQHSSNQKPSIAISRGAQFGDWKNQQGPRDPLMEAFSKKSSL